MGCCVSAVRIRVAMIAMCLLSGAGRALAQAPEPPSPTAGYQDGFFIQSRQRRQPAAVRLHRSDGRTLFGRRSDRHHEHLRDSKSAADVFRTCREVFRLQDHAGFRQRRDDDRPMRTSMSASRRSSASGPARTRRRSATKLLIGDAFLLFPERSLASNLRPEPRCRHSGAGRSRARSSSTPAASSTASPTARARPPTSTRTTARTSPAGSWCSRFEPRRRRPGALNGLGFQVGGSTGKQAGALPAFRTSVGADLFLRTPPGRRRTAGERGSRRRSSTTTSRSASSPSTCDRRRTVTSAAVDRRVHQHRLGRVGVVPADR